MKTLKLRIKDKHSKLLISLAMQVNFVYNYVYILSTSPWDNITAASDKIAWVKKYLGDVAKKRVILTHHKNLAKGDYLIDDRLKHGVDKFEGEHIHFGTDKFQNWNDVLNYLLTAE